MVADGDVGEVGGLEAGEDEVGPAVVLVVVAAPAVGDGVAEDDEGARAGGDVGLDGADEVPGWIVSVWSDCRDVLGIYQWTDLVPLNDVALTLFPATNQLVVLLPGWPVMELPLWPCWL